MSAVDGRYVLERLLAEPPLARVHLASHVVLEMRVTLRVLRDELRVSPELAQRYLRELRSASQIDGVLSVSDFALPETGPAYVVMEPPPGPALAERLASGPLALAIIFRLATQIARVLARAHDDGLVHGSLAAHEVFVGDDDVTAIAGFGDAMVARELDPPIPCGIAPEQAQGRNPEPPTDVYALGCLVFEMAAGRPVFEHDGIRLMIAHLLETPPRIRVARPEVSTGFDDLIAAMLAKQPADRPTLADVLDQLVRLGPPASLGRLVAGDQEANFLQILRTDPNDEATRMVYADWLETQGFDRRASFLRSDDRLPWPELVQLSDPEDAAWRAIVSRPPVARCGVRFRTPCDKRWDAMTPTDDDGVRHCAGCNQSVYFCTTVEQAHAHGARRECVAIDAALVEKDALRAYDDSQAGPAIPDPIPDPYPIRVGQPWWPRDPVIEPPVERKGLLRRIRGWFKRD